MSKNLPLIEEDDTTINCVVPLSSIRVYPTKENHELTKSIAKLGMIDLPILSEKPDGTYSITVGRRRIKSATILGWTDIKVRVEHNYSMQRDLASNLVRRSNPHHEFSCVRKLSRKKSNTDIAIEIGVSISRIRAIARYLALVPALQDKLEKGEITFNCAKELLKLPEIEQQKIARDLENITTKQVQGIAKNVQGAHIAFENLPIQLFSDRITLINRLRQDITMAEKHAPEAIEALQNALTLIEKAKD